MNERICFVFLALKCKKAKKKKKKLVHRFLGESIAHQISLRFYLTFKGFFSYLIILQTTLMNPFFVEKTCFFLEKHVFLTKNGIINVELMSIE